MNNPYAAGSYQCHCLLDLRVWTVLHPARYRSDQVMAVIQASGRSIGAISHHGVRELLPIQSNTESNSQYIYTNNCYVRYFFPSNSSPKKLTTSSKKKRERKINFAFVADHKELQNLCTRRPHAHTKDADNSVPAEEAAAISIPIGCA
jgi:hypothetical protein